MSSKTMAVLFLLLIMISGCAKTEMDGQAPELAPYIATLKMEYFEITGSHLNTDLPINLKPLSGDERGLCRKEKGVNKTAREIFIDLETFNEHKFEEDYITTILLHEIGHCVYDLDHVETLTDVGSFSIPSSVMYRSTLYTIPQMQTRKEFYYLEFFERVSK